MTTAAVLRADARRLPLPDASVDLVVTSPPYFGLRSYTDGGAHYAGQIGSEATPAEWLANLLDCTREWVRVLKPSGSIFVNLGDKFSQRVATRPSSHQDGLFPNRPELRKDWKRDRAAGLARMPYENIIDQETGAYVREKSLMGLPWRYALACMDQTAPHIREQFLEGLLDDVLDGTITHDEAARRLAEFDASPKSKGLGLILRRDIIWSKPNGLPESVTDRCRSAHEYVFHLVKQPRYYAAVDEIREPQLHDLKRVGTSNPRGAKWDGTAFGTSTRPAERILNPLGKLPGSVWSIPSQPLVVPAHLGVDHFAAFPLELPRRIIAGWSPPGICTACGEGRRPVSEVGYIQRQHDRLDTRIARNNGNNRNDGAQPFGSSALRQTTITGYACACPQPDAPARPAVVADPFGGTGTTALMAAALGRHGLSFDLSADYCRLARWRTTDRAEIAKAMQVPKPPAQTDGQDALFEVGA